MRPLPPEAAVALVEKHDSTVLILVSGRNIRPPIAVQVADCSEDGVFSGGITRAGERKGQSCRRRHDGERHEEANADQRRGKAKVAERWESAQASPAPKREAHHHNPPPACGEPQVSERPVIRRSRAGHLKSPWFLPRCRTVLLSEFCHVLFARAGAEEDEPTEAVVYYPACDQFEFAGTGAQQPR
jgi:hypothetical protein